MQTLWTRAAQTRGACSCPQCYQSVNGVSRRATAYATRRAPKYITSSTLWYSGIFAAAATFDASSKKRRREQWEQAISEVKQELGQPLNADHAQVEDIAREDQDLITPKSGLEALEETANIFEEKGLGRRRPQWPTNTGPPLMVHRLPPESVYATYDRKARAELSRWSPKKMERVMLSVDALQLEIFRHIQQGTDEEAKRQAYSAVPVDYRDKLFLSEAELCAAIEGKQANVKRLKEVHAQLPGWVRSEDDVPLSSYHQDDQGRYHDTAQMLNESLQQLFQQHSSKSLGKPSLLAKLAYNLSFSSAPPNIDTYNTILLGLSKVNSNLVNRTISSLRETHVRPNEVTNSTILRHYTATEDAAGFVRWVGLMRGKHGGLALARPDIRINEAGASRLIRKESTPDRPTKIIQLPYATPDVFGELIKGVLKFSGFDAALGICQGMGHEGWGLCMNGLTPLLVDCASRGDWSSGLAVWTQIQALKTRSERRYKKAGWKVEQIGLGTFAAMLRLCSECRQKETFQDVWRQAMIVHDSKANELAQMVQSPQEPDADHEPTLTPGLDLAEETSQATLELSDTVGLPEFDYVPVQPPERDSLALDSSTKRLALVTPTQHSNGPSAVQILRELAVKKPTPRLTATGEHSKTASRTAKKEPPTLSFSTPLLQVQLHGSLPPSYELDDYELRERPMTMYE